MQFQVKLGMELPMWQSKASSFRAKETQQSGLDWGYKLGYEGYLAPASEIWPGVPAVLQAVEILFGTLFCLECILKGAAYRRLQPSYLFVDHGDSSHHHWSRRDMGMALVIGSS